MLLPFKYFVPMVAIGAGGFHVGSCLYQCSYKIPELDLKNLEVVNKDGNLSDSGWWFVKKKGSG